LIEATPDSGADPQAAARIFLERWFRAIVAKDVAECARLRAPGYAAITGGHNLSREEELALIGSDELTLTSVEVEQVVAVPEGSGHALSFRSTLRGARQDAELAPVYAGRMIVSTGADASWRGESLHMHEEAAVRTDGAPAQRAAGGLGDRLKRALGRAGADRFRRASFQEIAYIPYEAREDFALPRTPRNDPDPADLPIPPRHLWLGYDYPTTGKAHVRRMLEIAREDGFAFAPGDRILDLGCGAGRMIRHLKDLAQSCEIWGCDISAEHIFWCKRNLSPPFNFFVNTKVPHLPHRDGSFRFIYCGSLFTHIDDLTDTWLLELRRLLGPDGRAYITIHDAHSIELIEQQRPQLWERVSTSPLFAQARRSFDMLTVGRDDGSQVFYDRDYFLRSLEAMFEIRSVTPEAYNYQTAVLVKPKG
jgi:SAM-dependent methyltransferase